MLVNPQARSRVRTLALSAQAAIEAAAADPTPARQAEAESALAAFQKEATPRVVLELLADIQSAAKIKPDHVRVILATFHLNCPDPDRVKAAAQAATAIKA